MTGRPDREVTEGELNDLLDAYREHWKRIEGHILTLLHGLQKPAARLSGNEIAAIHRRAMRPTGVGGTLSFSDATPIMTCQCGVRCFGDAVNDALAAWGSHVTTAHRDDW